MERITQRVQGLTPVLSGTRVEVQGGFARPPMERDARMITTFEQAKTIAAQHGMTLSEGGTGGASDGNYTAAVGTPTLDGLGPLGDGAHSEREYVKTGGLVTSATLLAALLLGWPRE
jgi:glutamate carboxypeptidase